MGGSISWVFSAGNVSSDDGAVCFIHEGMNAFEGVICGFIPTVSVPPALNHTSVVSENFEMNVGGARGDDVSDQEFKSNAFSPSDVPPIRVPSWVQCPGLPLLTNDDANSNP